MKPLFEIDNSLIKKISEKAKLFSLFKEEEFRMKERMIKHPGFVIYKAVNNIKYPIDMCRKERFINYCACVLSYLNTIDPSRSNIYSVTCILEQANERNELINVIHPRLIRNVRNYIETNMELLDK